MEYISINDLMQKSGSSIYKLVIAASRRAVELGSGSAKLVEAPPNAKPTSIALKEMRENKITYKIAGK